MTSAIDLETPRRGLPGGRALGLAAAVAVLALVVVLSLAVGSRPVAPATALTAIVGYDPSDQGQVIVREVRGPRTAIGLLAGVALGLAGALMQGITRNPLAD